MRSKTPKVPARPTWKYDSITGEYRLPLGVFELRLYPGCAEVKRGRKRMWQWFAHLYSRNARADHQPITIDLQRFDDLAAAQERAIRWVKTIFEDILADLPESESEVERWERDRWRSSNRR